MDDVIINKNDIWYALFSNGDYKELTSLEEGVNIKPRYIVKDIYKDFFKGHSLWRISKFKFYNKKGEEIYLEEGEWKIKNIDEKFRRSIKNITEFTFQDPRKEIRKLTFSEDSDGFDRFCKINEAINYLEKRSSFSSWNEYELSTQINSLNEKILKLESEISDIKQMLLKK